jgi:phosphotransferase family enzyme
MPRHRVLEILTEGVREHRAAQAWLELQPESRAPRSLELLQRRRYSTVYRLNDVRHDGTGVIAKRCRAATARKERMIYQELLPLTGMPALECYGMVKEPDGEFFWVFLEDAKDAAYSPQLSENRALAGRWLAETQLATASPNLQSCLPTRALNHYLQSLDGCRTIALHHLGVNELPAGDAEVLRKIATYIDAIELLWNQIEEICEVMPRSLVHGDFVIKNIRIRDTAAGPALLVFDWEFAGWGLPATDLAQFTDKVASPDLSIYCSILRREHSHLNLRDIQAVAACGNLLRMVDQISWATAGYEFVSPPQLSKLIGLLGCYEPSMIEALNAFRMELT